MGFFGNVPIWGKIPFADIDKTEELTTSGEYKFEPAFRDGMLVKISIVPNPEFKSKLPKMENPPHPPKRLGRQCNSCMGTGRFFLG